jgi:hypothetical protein
MKLNDYLDMEEQVQETLESLINKFEIINFSPYGKTSSKWYATIKFDNELYKIKFSLSPLKLISRIIEQGTNNIISTNQLFEKISIGLPEVMKKDHIRLSVKNSFPNFFKDILPKKIEENLTNSLIAELKDKNEITFTKFEPGVLTFSIYCNLKMFDEDFELRIVQEESYFRVFSLNKRDFDISKWLLNKKENNIISNDGPILEEYNVIKILGGLVIQKFKETTEYKLLRLYDMDFKKLFN